MILYKDALSRLLEAVSSRGLEPAETVPLQSALGRVAAEAALSPERLPAFDNSAMDGFAVRAKETAGARPGRPVRLELLGSIAAGQRAPSGRQAARAGAYEIMTGAPIPRGFDAIVRVEDARTDGSSLLVASPAQPGCWVRGSGSDLEAGAELLKAGERVAPRHLLALAAVGTKNLRVRRRPRVSLVSTGSELCAPGERPGPGRIRNATGPYLAAALSCWGAEFAAARTAGDERDALVRALKSAREQAPFIVTTGAVSMGRLDLVPAALSALGAEVLFHRVAIKPGRPFLAARLPGGALVFSLPGNPVSTAVGWRFFLEPALRLRLGRPEELPQPGRILHKCLKPEGLRCFFKASFDGRHARVLPGQGSHQVLPLLQADGWAVLPEKGGSVAAGTELPVYPVEAR